MPAGWVHGKLGDIASVSDAQSSEPDLRRIEMVLTEFFAGDNDGFIAWIGEKTKTLAHAHDLAMRDADLETVLQFMKAKARCTRAFIAPEPSVTGNRMNQDSTMLFTDENGTQL
jgi:hypothetical protein